MAEQEPSVWIHSPEEVEKMPDEVRNVLEEMDRDAPPHDVGLAA